MREEDILKLEEKIQKEYGNIAGIVVRKENKDVYEKYFHDCTKSSRLHVYSVSKSILSLLAGIALEKGYIGSIDQKVLEFFPDYKVKKGETTIQKVTLKDLLTMTAPYKYKIPVCTYIRYFRSSDWLKFTLDLLGGKKPIGRFNYTPLVGPDILSGILMKAAGKPVLDFAAETLFTPLDIAVEKSIVFQSVKEQSEFNKSTAVSGWVSDPTGLNSGGWGLTLSAVDMAKIGQLCVDGGRWKGQQIVPEEWITESTREHSRWEEQNLPFGYLWWIIDKNEHACAAMGDGGNVIYFNEKKKLVIAIASMFVRDAKDRIAFIREYLEPVFEDV